MTGLLFGGSLDDKKGWNGAYRNNARVSEKKEAGGCKGCRGGLFLLDFF